MERLAQTKRRNGKDEPRKKRHKSNETLDYLREAAEKECKIIQDELEMKKKQEEATMATQQALLTQLQDQQQLQMQHKYISPEVVKQSRSLRHSRDHKYSFIQIQTRVDSYKYSFFLRTIIDWNSLPKSVVCQPSAVRFKNAVLRYFNNM